ncbi:MBL fold metallo-hydrolase [Kribbella kalugense]|uniref:Glyoxylase-like metal-dependent hydrolase (Beta-lactamase superfamily II) n=1 Tax=Kribbella kalugense TaxID=2512221 RepID=A0A4V3G880_9ACTN|nr:MBL fold metallo-hydrolase [Kribbella kalugense]TDW21934.1 glyoxylase-like metal-dependent hydrolase (beta-lactamase superfamily II) [Kribbella kalugense]
MVGLSVFLSPYKPFTGASKSWDPATQATWPASTATLIEGERDAVLVDGLMTLAEGDELLAWIRQSGKRLTAVYVTHAHADHFFGLEPVLTAFPDADLVTHASVAPVAAGQVSTGALALWNSYFPGQISEHPAVPAALPTDDLLLEGQSLKTVLVGQSDVELSTVVHVPWLDAVVAGDVAYNRVHMWLAGSDPKTRAAWIDSLDAIEALRPVTVISGHKDPDAPDDDATRILDESRQYIRDFDAVVATGDPAPQIVAKMVAKYPAFGNPYTLTYAADSQRP